MRDAIQAAARVREARSTANPTDGMLAGILKLPRYRGWPPRPEKRQESESFRFTLRSFIESLVEMYCGQENSRGEVIAHTHVVASLSRSSDLRMQV